MQRFLGFAASKQAMAVVHSFAQAQAAQQQQWALSRLQQAAAFTAVRCAAAPLYGQDLREVRQVLCATLSMVGCGVARQGDLDLQQDSHYARCQPSPGAS